MKHLTPWSLALAGALLIAGCGKAKAPEPAKTAAAAKKGVAAAKKVAEAANTEAKTTATVAADSKEALAQAAKQAAVKTAATAKKEAAQAAPAAGAAANVPADWAAVLKDPSKATATAPAVFKVKFTTTKGDFVMTVHRDWAPKGADRFYHLVKSGFFTDIGFFRNIGGFMCQFGIHGSPAINRACRAARISDDKPTESNKLGYVTFATSGKDSRTTQIFINYKDNGFLDDMGFTPFAIIDAEGMAVVNKLYKGYGEGAPRGKGPDQGRLQGEGNTYLKAAFPLMDFAKTAVVLDGK